MLRTTTIVIVILICSLVGNAQQCGYWLHKIDPGGWTEGKVQIDEKLETNVVAGIKCFLSQQGNKREGLGLRNQDDLSQLLPIPTVEVDSLFYVSFLFYGNMDFSQAVALIGVPAKTHGEFETVTFNSPSDVRKAYASYRKWFKLVKKLGLDEARRQKLDPLANSGVRWY